MKSNIRSISRCAQDVVALLLMACIITYLNKFVQPFQRGFFCEDDSLRLSFKKSTVPSIVLFSIIFITTPILIVLTEVLIHFGKLSAISDTFPPIPEIVISLYKYGGTFALGFAVTQLVTDILKISIGRLRPHFFDLCRPDYNMSTCPHVYITNFTCHPIFGTFYDHSFNIRRSFPSGHASVIIYWATFITLYLHHRYKSEKCLRNVHGLKIVIQVASIGAAVYIAISRVMDHKHHGSDVLAGGVIGVIFGVCTPYIITDAYSTKEKVAPEYETNGSA